MQIITFTFNPARESDFHQSIALCKENFPGAFRQGYNNKQLADRGIRITCTGEQFLKWLFARNEMGFVNRFKQLNPIMTWTSTREHLDNRSLQSHQPLTPIDYATPEAQGLR